MRHSALKPIGMQETRRPLKVAVIGCGGVGTEVIKLLKCSNTACKNTSLSEPLYDISVVDSDKVELSNLSRQFFYRALDSGEYKATICAKRIGCEGWVGRLQDLPPGWLDQFDIVIGCLDNVPARMELNYRVRCSKCPLLIDCGVDGLQAHVKLVSPADPCLYCIRDLYVLPSVPSLCGMRSLSEPIDVSNRDKVLYSLIYKERERYEEDAKQCGEINSEEGQNNTNCLSMCEINEGHRASLHFHSKDRRKEVIQSIVHDFNKHVSLSLKTTYFEVEGYFDRIVPNVCTINAICASMAVQMIGRERIYDFAFFDGREGFSIKYLRLKRDANCLICKSA